MTFGRPFGRNTHYYLTLRNDTIHGTNDNNDVVPEILLAESNVRSIALSRVYDSRNSILNPSAGSYTSVTAEFAGLGGAPFTKYTGDVRHYWNLNSKRTPPSQPTPGSKKKPPLPLVYATRFWAGLIAGAPPTLDEFLVGGADSLRGYKEDRFPGERMVLWNNELRIPFTEALQLVAFVDAGDAWQGQFADEFGDSAFQLHFGYGLGIRVVTPIGPLRLDYGFNNVGGHEFHFGVGPTF